MNYTQHPLSAAFPSMSTEDFQSLKDSIEVNGVLNPITLFEGQVIDGWHRYQAANDLVMDCPTQELGNIDPKDFVLAQNKNRRHITSAQLSAATTAVYSWVPSVGVNQHTKSAPALSAAPQKTTAEMAAIAGVSERSIHQAKTVQRDAAPEVKQAVRDGKIGLPKAVAISKMPMAEQAEAINKPLPKPDLVASSVDVIDEDKEAIGILVEENERLNDRLAVAAMDATEEERASAAATLHELRMENKLLRSMNKQLTISRDAFQNQVAEMQKQINRQRREIDRALGTKTA